MIHYDKIKATYNMKRFEEALGSSPLTFENVCHLIADSTPDSVSKNALVTSASVFFQALCFKKSGEKVYRIEDNLAVMLSQTSLKKVETKFVRCPFPTIYLQIPKMYQLKDPETGLHFVEGIYISETPDFFRLLCVGAKNEHSQHELDDCLFFFKIFKTRETIEECLDYTDDHIHKTEADREYDLPDNYKNLGREVFNFVVNCLLYITGANADLKWVNRRAEVEARLRRVKGSKRAKLERQLSNAHPYCSVGGSIVIDRSRDREPSECEKGSGTKLSYRFSVAGHWKRQHYGEKWSKEKMIFVEPYNKGPELADVVNKIHRVQ
jgi:hypothetical protein